MLLFLFLFLFSQMSHNVFRANKFVVNSAFCFASIRTFANTFLFICFCYHIGMHFSQAVAIIQSQVGVIKGVQVLYSETVSSKLNSKLNFQVQTKYAFVMICHFCVSISESIRSGYCDKFTIGWY